MGGSCRRSKAASVGGLFFIQIWIIKLECIASLRTGIPDHFVLARDGSRIPGRVIWRTEKRIGIAFVGRLRTEQKRSSIVFIRRRRSAFHACKKRPGRNSKWR
jgi:hypothetical protein